MYGQDPWFDPRFHSGDPYENRLAGDARDYARYLDADYMTGQLHDARNLDDRAATMREFEVLQRQQMDRVRPENHPSGCSLAESGDRVHTKASPVAAHLTLFHSMNAERAR